MDQKLIQFILKPRKLKNIEIAIIDALLLFCAPIFGFLLRQTVCGYFAFDYLPYISIAGYMAYVSMAFDLALAVLSGIYVAGKTKGKLRGFLTYAMVLLLPVMASGSAMWKMGDSIYLSFVVLALICMEQKKYFLSVVVYSVAVFLNPYALFILPVFLAKYLMADLKLVYLLLPLAGAWIRNGFYQMKSAGVLFPIFEAEKMLKQFRGEVLLTYNWPGFYQLTGPDKFVSEYMLVAKAAMVLLTVVMSVLIVRPWNTETKKVDILAMSAFLSMLFSYLCPGSDERCGLLATVLLVLLAFTREKLYYVAILQTIITYIAYSTYFRPESVIPLAYVSLVQLALILVMARYAFYGEILSIAFVKEEKQ